eukprot:scaffold48902_cov30-Tisochrysis_lutea.AAC.1
MCLEHRLRGARVPSRESAVLHVGRPLALEQEKDLVASAACWSERQLHLRGEIRQERADTPGRAQEATARRSLTQTTARQPLGAATHRPRWAPVVEWPVDNAAKRAAVG